MSLSAAAVGTIGARRAGAAYNWTSETAESLILTASAGVGVADGNPVPTWTEQVASATFTEATNQPDYRASSIRGLPAVDFNGTNDRLTSSAMTVSGLIGAGSTAWCVLAVAHIDAIASSAKAYNNSDTILADTAGGYFGMFVWNNAGTYQLLAYVYDGAIKYADAVIGGALPTNGVVLEMRLTGGNLIASVNGTDGTPVACGAMNAGGNAGLLRVGANTAGALNFNGQIAMINGKQDGTKPTTGIAAYQALYV